MKIASANVQLRSSHIATSSFESNERLEISVGDRRGSTSGVNGIGTVVREAARTQVEFSKEARALQGTEATGNDDEIDTDPRMRFLKELIEALIRNTNRRDSLRKGPSRRLMGRKSASSSISRWSATTAKPPMCGCVWATRG